MPPSPGPIPGAALPSPGAASLSPGGGAASPQRPVSLNVSASPHVRTSLLHRSASSGDAAELRRLLVEEKVPVYTTTPDGTSALHCAAETGHAGESCVRLDR